ncbi:SDR family oxidoreductase [Albimonas pacifica]|uniref:Short-chain dehydrogenase n=1 Tax=Albimonas pacifica TaxID=1114924 RepID=A0A1I3BM02_9RHOB|nr:SDR family oxidoreductase [Albimonas pacifica]SFH63307.1 Short-chain dehydrogenase [Albimonas pacifica]
MKVEGSVALVTGANRGLGLAFARALLARGAAKVYAGARDPGSVTLAGVVPLKLDVTSQAEVAAAAEQARDVTLLVNNAGIAMTGAFAEAGAIERMRAQFETNAVGTLRTALAFAPALAANGGGGIVNVLSIASWINGPLLATYGVSKAAAWSITNGLRLELAGQGTQVVGMHAGFIDTDLTQGLDLPKVTPESVAEATLEALERGELEVLADDPSRMIRAGLGAERGVYLDPPAV